MDITEIWLRLAAVEGIKAEDRRKMAEKLMQLSGTQASLSDVPGLTQKQRQQFLRLNEKSLVQTQKWLEGENHHFLTLSDPRYPRLLTEIAARPLCLFVKGDPGALSTAQIAVVGSRRSTRYGEHWGAFFSESLSLSGMTITSGLALGIDGVAHRSALSCRGKTVAVLGSGLLNLYPARHRSLSHEIVAQGGALVSEFPLMAPPLPGHFPRRNRIISGLSLGVLVVEAGVKSGSLITARYALEQNRNIYALPGPLGKPETEGTHWLIKEGALLVSHPNDLLEDLQTGCHSLRFSASEEINSPGEGTVPLPFADVLANVEDEVTPVDVVAERAGQPVPVIAAALLELELAGWIAAVPGGYVRLRRACHVRRTYVLV
ncbi:Rossmann fold nucleotide-binding protein [Tatumella ptyseos ATCC 33301]|uniref:Rossmann fold nucleotide-binding protein n=2 Tax=Tatumella ptyseos TaxID=82987 RepID=A0A085JPI8_9GAMM|nr:DNA-protecting protein DprA [Tatumella ptyseos]KFD22384.1 Rossmann fold nucleotide-binding protein [Tatumella ptyseos ATCC 33301]SQK71777.1 DNA protecting protein DprA [Tatumella ptyseos]